MTDVNPIFHKTDIPKGATHFMVVSSWMKRGETTVCIRWLRKDGEQWRLYETCVDDRDSCWWPVSSRLSEYINDVPPISINKERDDE